MIEVEGAGWCQTDNHVIEGMWTDYLDQELPMTLGHENAGEVVEVGSEVSTVEVGEKVICHPLMTCGTCRQCRLGNDMHCEAGEFPGLTTDGGFAEYLLTSDRATIPLSGVDPIDIAPHADAGITAYHAAKKAAAKLVPGDYVVVIGVGGLGHIGVQALDALTPARIIALDIKDEALSLADRVGADYTINPSTEDAVAEVESITDGKLAEQAIDFVGADVTTAMGPDIVAGRGDFHVVGYGGMVEEPAQTLVNNELAYRGTLVGTYAELQELVALVEEGAMDLHADQYALDEINTVAEKLEHGEIEGRAVIVP